MSLVEQRATDYRLTANEANELLGVVLLPHEIRLAALTKFLKDRGADALVNLFSQFIGMANSVISNSHDAVELFLIVEKDWDPYKAEKLNFPTLFGALNGVKLTEGVDQDATCHGCACRLGSLANQSPGTTVDADWCLKGDDVFYCHENMDGETPTKRCAGIQALKKKHPAHH